jgi:hypothetical protein
MTTHQMQLLGNSVFICPICFHMVRFTPFEDRKFTVLIEGDASVSHSGATTDDLQLYPAIRLLNRLERLLTGHPVQPQTHSDTTCTEDFQKCPLSLAVDWIYLN